MKFSVHVDHMYMYIKELFVMRSITTGLTCSESPLTKHFMMVMQVIILNTHISRALNL